jgi:CBS domain containing-hemolysin-like protein
LAILTTVIFARLGQIGNVISRTTLERLKEEGVTRASLYLWIYRSRDFMLQMIILAQTLAIAIGSFAIFHLSDLLANIQPNYWIFFGRLVAVGAFVVIALLLRNIVPAYRREEGSERPLPLLPILCFPVYLVLLFPTILLQQAQILFVSDDDNKARKEEEIRSFVDSETEEGSMEPEEREMIERVFDFRETTVKEVMIPRIDMVSAEITTTTEELIDLIRESRHSRLPIYEERIDNIKGVVYAKDLLLQLDAETPWIIPDIMRTPYFVPENKTLGDLMAEFKHEKVHMAIVVDEYGGTSGLVTMEDIIEEIVGEIQDEHDEEEPLFSWQEVGRILIADARLDIEDLNLMFNVELPQEGYETLGGFIYSHLGHVPETGEQLEYNNLLMLIKKVEGHRITKVRIEKREINLNYQSDNIEIA